MGMSVKLGSTTDDPRKITKIIAWDNAAIPCYPTDPCDMLNPTLILTYHDTGIFSKNYANIYAWGNRMYFIKDIQVLTGGKILLSLSIDVLYTYDTAIKACKCCVTRSESAGVNWVVDSQYPINPNKKHLIDNRTLSTPFKTGDPTFFVDFSEYDQYTFALPQHIQP